MPASTGQIVSSTTTPNGQTITVAWFYDPATRQLRNNPTPWTSPGGTTWPAGTGAVLADNTTGQTINGRVNNPAGTALRRLTFPPGVKVYPAAALTLLTAPDGPFLTADDLNGFTFESV